MRTLLLALICMLPTSGSALTLLSLRDPLYSDTRLADQDVWQLGQLPDSLWQDSSRAFVTNPLGYLQPETLDQLTARLKGKRVLVLIHGMAKTLATAQKDFFNGLWSVERSNLNVDEVVLVSWPGTRQVSIGGFLKANPLASRSGKRLATVFKSLNEAGCALHVVTHSMGSKVALRALKKGARVDGLYMMAPSVLQWSIRPGRRWHRGIKRVEGTPLVLYSRNDWALSFSVVSRLGLGHNGVRLRNSDRLTQVDCSHVINQSAFAVLPRSFFGTRSNHSMYWQVESVFHTITSIIDEN